MALSRGGWVEMLKFIYLLVFLQSLPVLALPIGFGINQDDVVYHETTNPNFNVYHDARTPREGRMVLESLEKARPVLEKWFAATHPSPLTVIVSAETANASFANFVTDAIELQTLGQGYRDLYWHEYVHMMTYQQLRNFLGPAGTIVHLPWMPAWFLEGLAEALADSTGSSIRSGIERYHALHNAWPTYDKLHSLYTDQNFFERGYASAGAFVSWLLRKGYAKSQNFLPEFLERFYKYTLPYYYPLSFNPFSEFMPFDDALRDFFAKDGRQLYDEYKLEAGVYWLSQRQTSLLPAGNMNKEDEAKWVDSISIVRSSESYLLKRLENDDLIERRLRFDSKTGFYLGSDSTGNVFTKDLSPILSMVDKEFPVAIEVYPKLSNGLARNRLVLLKKDDAVFVKDSVLFEREGQIISVGQSEDKIYWSEERYEVSRICYIEKSRIRAGRLPVSVKDVNCPISVNLPQSLKIIGHEDEGRNPSLAPSRVWYSVVTQTIQGDHFELWQWLPTKNQATRLQYSGQAKPKALVKSLDSYWFLLSDRSNDVLEEVKVDGSCVSRLPLDDYVLAMSGFKEEASLLLTLFAGEHNTARKVKIADLERKPCQENSGHISPILQAMRQQGTLAEIVQLSSLWSDKKELAEGEAIDQDPIFIARTTALLKEAASNPSPNSKTDAKTNEAKLAPLGENLVEPTAVDEEAKWRGHPVLGIPWIGADDPRGYQLGIVSIPLMDRLQNETLTLSFLVGLESRYPNSELSLVSTRFRPTLSLSVYRRLLWDGQYQASADINDIQSSYTDEKGLRFGADISYFFQKLTLSLSGGFMLGYRDYYIGPTIEGRFIQPFAGVSFTGNLYKWAWLVAFNGNINPKGLNKNFDYNELGAQTQVARKLPFLSSSFSLSLSGSRTRGPLEKTPGLKQIYLPLKTFIPGSGGGYNQNSYALLGHGSLLSARIGDTKARSELEWHFPIIKDWDKISWIFYFNELRFSSFVNYGGTWYQWQDAKKHFLLAHGYSIDVLFENKGVHLNTGLGLGQVVPGSWLVFLKAGFDMFL